jgi:beta-ring hydroxylase
MEAIGWIWRIVAAAFVATATAGLCFLTYYGIETFQRRRKLSSIPLGSGQVPILGHMIALMKAPEPWSLMLQWLNASKGDIVRFCLPLDDWVVVRGGDAMRAVLQTHLRDFNKEIALSFHPFLCILGSGLVTSHGELWQKQRRLMTPAFKGDILQEVICISLRATSRLAAKLDACRIAASTIEVDEEFRLLTLQVCKSIESNQVSTTN